MGRTHTRRAFLGSALAGGAAALAGCRTRAASLELDLAITGGTLVDGSGRPGERGDLGIRGGRIVRAGALQGARAVRTIDARGLHVAPGFVDVHAHTAFRRDRLGESKLFQGVTLDVTGPDGGSPFPRRRAGEEPVTGVEQCTDFDHWAARFDRLGLHLGSYVGHGTVRTLVLGPTPREPDGRELELMRALVRRALEQGALGLSSGLEYAPASFATTAEVIALARVAAEFGRPYVTHIRNEDLALLEAVDEAIEIARRSGAPLLLSHLKVGGRPNWHKIDALLERLESARAAGLDVRCDRYPYEAWATTLAINFPAWASEGGKFRERLRDPAERARMRPETMQNVDAVGGFGALMIAGGVADPALVGLRVDEAATARGAEPFELCCDLLAEGDVSIIGFGMDEANTERIVALPYCMIASDGSALPAAGAERVHPRSFGTFPRALRRYVRERGLFSLEECVRKMTALPASTLGLRDRGTLREGAAADVVVFSAHDITDHATYVEPRRLAAGVDWLVVGGELAIERGAVTGALGGRVVRAG